VTALQRRFCACLLAILSAAGCTAPTGREIRIGINPWPGYAFLYLAEDHGYFTAEGVDVRLIEYGSLGDVRRGYELGQVEGMCTTVVEVLHALHESRRQPRVVIPADISSGADVLIARPPLLTAAALAGRRVAVERYSLGYLVLARALAQAGLGLRDVSPVPMDPSQMIEAMREGAVDAAVIYPPESIAMRDQALGQVVFSSAAMPGEILDVVTFDAEVIATRRDDVARIVRAFDRAVLYAMEHPDAAHREMAAREGMSLDAFRDALRGMTIVMPGERAAVLAGVAPAIVKRTDQVLRDAGLLEGPRRWPELLADTAAGVAAARMPTSEPGLRQ